MDVDQIVATLRQEIQGYAEPSVTRVAESRDPYRVLVSCLLSLRTRDAVTYKAAELLFALADTPERMLAMDEALIAKTIYPVAFFNVKAKTIREVSKVILDQHTGKVPDTMEGLLALKGVGRKTANIVLTLGFGKDGIAVDTHVHRISNRLGLVKTRSPEETEYALRDLLPRKHWLSWNDLLVTWGQNICVPISPKCSQCALQGACPKVGVEKSR